MIHRLKLHNLHHRKDPLIYLSTNQFNMSSQQIATHRENAQVYTGEALCKQKSLELLQKMRLPRGLLPLDDIVEVGYNEGSGFVWLKQKKSKTHVFRSISRSVWYDTEVTAFVDDRRMKRLTGVKSKELLIWVGIGDISIEDPNSGKITFSTPTGISRSFPVSAFEEEEKDNGKY
ncbi:hypothetical protein BUALT_Bualt03G0026300 [Buddleja alternifolia]|uniref:Uncharacterized protein n=1 Tax=Buddleja alternifolia TaxID=168488 RepID=A0AAV6XXD2_9LAMI|nr:hypothetical protein BUALT_Bualt03G0026300 [Buddleja alternifolia]